MLTASLESKLRRLHLRRFLGARSVEEFGVGEIDCKLERASFVRNLGDFGVGFRTRVRVFERRRTSGGKLDIFNFCWTHRIS